MKASTIIFSALATLVAAAPTEKVEERAAFDFNSQFNGLKGFGQQNLNYLLSVNIFDLNFLGQLGQVNNLDLFAFQGLFQQNQAFDVASLLALQQIQDILIFGQAGLFNGFDLAGLQLGALDLGLLSNGVGNLGLQQFIQGNVVAQVQTVANQVLVLKE